MLSSVGSMPQIVELADPGVPDSRGPIRFLWWLLTRQRGRIALSALWSTLWLATVIAPPYLVQRAIDDGLARDDSGALLGWAAILVAVGVLNAVFGLLRHRVMTYIRTGTALCTARVLVRHTVRLGAALPRSVSAGETVNIGATDIWRIARAYLVTGPGIGSVLAYLGVAVLLVSISPALAIVVLVGVPLVALTVSPLLGRMQRAETRYRARQGGLTARVGDIVGGLRVLGGIGGKDLFAGHYRRHSADLRDEGYRVGAVTSWINAISAGIPGVFVACVVWLGARMAVAGEISTGQLVAVYGFVAALAIPVFFVIESVDELGRAVVSARRVTAVLALEPAPDAGPHVPAPRGPAELHDPDTGLTVGAGRFVGVVTADSTVASALIDRLARYRDSATTWGGIPLRDIELGEIRDRVLAADPDARLFAGSLRDVLAVGGDRSADELRSAITDAVASDVVDALPDGFESTMDGQARGVSGGQRQRLRLARALLAESEVLLLTEPTSAVDAHTEAAIAARIRARRTGRTTVVVTSSPLVLDQADEVAYLSDGVVAATGTHARLLTAEPGYRRLVFGGAEDEDLAEASR